MPSFTAAGGAAHQTSTPATGWPWCSRCWRRPSPGNLGTWYFGIPASSSHTLIGSILGVGLANALISDLPLGEGVNWGKAIDIGLSLIFSPRPASWSQPWCC